MKVRLTSVGWLVLGEAALLLSSRWWPARAIPEPATMALGVALVAVVAVAWWLAPRQALAGEAHWLVAPRVPVGEEVTVGATLTVHGSLPPCSLFAQNPMTRKREEVVRLRALSAGSVRPTWTVRFSKRGVFHLPPLRLRCTQPFGVISVDRAVGSGCEVVVLPAMGQMRRALRERLDSWSAELQPTTDAGADELDHLRPYRQGDQRRAIHWRASARHGELLVSERMDPGCRRLAIVLDTSGRGPNGVLEGRRFEKLVAATATLAEACCKRGWQVTVHGGFAPGGISGDISHLLEGLAMASCDGAQLLDLIPAQPAVAVLTARPGDVPAMTRRPLILSLADIDDLFRLPARLRA